MYTIDILGKGLLDLAKALKPVLNGSIIYLNVYYIGVDDQIQVCVTYDDLVYGKLTKSAWVDKKGDVYNPMFYGHELSVLFDWLNRVGYCRERQTKRTELFKQELIAKICSMEYPS